MSNALKTAFITEITKGLAKYRWVDIRDILEKCIHHEDFTEKEGYIPKGTPSLRQSNIKT